MNNFKILCFSFLTCFLFINCSFAQERQTQNSSASKQNKTSQISSSNNTKTIGFVSKEGNFSINISEPLLKTLDKNPGKQFVWRFGNKIFTLYYRPHTDFETASKSKQQQFQDMNNGFRTGLKRQGINLFSEKDIVYGKYSGKEFHYEINGYKFIARQYLIDKMGYQIIGAHNIEEARIEVLDVLNSFRVLDKQSEK